MSLPEDEDRTDRPADSPQPANPLDADADGAPLAGETPEPIPPSMTGSPGQFMPMAPANMAPAPDEPTPPAETADKVPVTPDDPAPAPDREPPAPVTSSTWNEPAAPAAAPTTWNEPAPTPAPSQSLDETTTTQAVSAPPIQQSAPAPSQSGWQQSPVQPQQSTPPATPEPPAAPATPPTPQSQWPQQPSTGWQQPAAPAQQGWQQQPQAPAQQGWQQPAGPAQPAAPQQQWQQPAQQWQQPAQQAWQQPAPPYGQPYAQPGYPAQAGYYQQEAPYGSSGFATIAGLLLLLLGLVDVIGGALLFVNPQPLSNFVGRVQEINVGIRLTRDSLGAMPAVLLVMGVVELLAAVGVFGHKTWGRVLGILASLVGLAISVAGVALAMAVAPGASVQMIIMAVALVSYALILLGLLFGGGHFRRRYPQR